MQLDASVPIDSTLYKWVESNPLWQKAVAGPSSWRVGSTQRREKTMTQMRLETYPAGEFELGDEFWDGVTANNLF